MVRRIEVSLKPEFTDAAAESLLHRLQADYGLSGLKIARQRRLGSARRQELQQRVQLAGLDLPPLLLEVC